MSIKRGQVFVRAKSPSGKWGSHDVLDLTDDSFRAWVVFELSKLGVIAMLKDEYVKGEPIEYESRVEEMEGGEEDE